MNSAVEYIEKVNKFVKTIPKKYWGYSKILKTESYDYNHATGTFMMLNRSSINFNTQRPTNYSKKVFEILYWHLKYKGRTKDRVVSVFVTRDDIWSRLTTKTISAEKLNNPDWLRWTLKGLRDKFQSVGGYLRLTSYSNRENGYYFSVDLP